MSINYKYYFLVCFSILSLHVFSQGENKVWYFGGQAGLDFATNPPTVLTNGSLWTGEGCASISNAAGNILFYTDGSTIFNQLHATMANGTGLTGNSSTTQSAIIVKQPGNTNIYFVFTLGVSNGQLCYSIVDMSLAAGMGSVTTKNTLVYATCTEKLTSVKHCNGVDIWVVYREGGTSNTYRANLVTAAGFNSTAVLSTIGSNCYGGCLKISPNGRKMASAIYVNGVGCEIYDFDASTGVVSNSLALGSSGYLYGCEFSPDGTKLYGSGNNKLFQWDLCAGSPTAIAASEYSLSTASNWGLQLATDGKIYVSISAQTSLSVINNPNLAGSAMGYSNMAVSIAPQAAWLGLPNFITSGFKPPPPPFTYTANNNSVYGCQTASFAPPSAVMGTSNTACATSGYAVTGVLWSFGDPGSGVNNTSFLSNPLHTFTSLGTYTVSLILYYSCGTDTIRQVVTINQSCISVTSTSITCANLGSATVAATGGVGPYSYTWMPTAQTSSVATGLSPGTYTLTVFDFGNNFTYTAQTQFTSLVPLTGNVNNSGSIACNGASTATASVTGFAGGSGTVTYLWFNTSTSYTTPTPLLSGGLWSVTVTDALTGCQVNQSLYITQPPPFNLTLSSATPTSCAGTSIVLTGTNSGGTPFTAGPAYTYTWTGGPAAPSKTVSQALAGTYIYTLNSTDANNCITNNTISVDFISNPVLSVSNVSVCPLEVGTLTVSGAGSYTWTSATLSFAGNTFTDSPGGSTQYSVVGSALGCTAMATASIILKGLPVVMLNNNNPVCNGEDLNLFGNGGVSYAWTGPLGYSSSLQYPVIMAAIPNNSGVYNLTVTAANNCTAAASKTIVVNPTPTLSASGATVCTSQGLSFSANSNAGSYLWTGPLSFTSNNQNPTIANPLTTQSGTYTVKATSAFGCTNSAIVVVSVIPPPSLTIALSSPSLCAQAFNGSPNTITLTSSGAGSYTLQTPFVNIGNPNGPVSSLNTQPPYGSGVGTATLYGSNGVCTVSTTTSFSIIPNPTVTVSSPTPVICAGENYTYTSFGAASYTWGPNSPGITTYSTGSIAVANPSLNSVFSVYGGSLGCNSTIRSTTITVNPLPKFTIVPGAAAICLNEQTILTANGNAGTYTWSPHNGLASFNGSTVIAGPLTQQTYTVIGTLNSCTNSAMITVSVLPLPNPSANILKPKLCLYELVTLQGFGGTNYYWKSPLDAGTENYSFAGQTATFIANNPYYAGTYTLTVSDENNCHNSTTTLLTLNSLPDGNLSGTKMKDCIPFSSDFTFYSASQVESEWQVDGKTFKAKNFSYPFKTAGTYSITGNLIDTATKCVSTKTFVVEAYPKPVADYNYFPERPIENLDEVLFTNTSSGEQQTKWNWYFVSNKGYTSENKNPSYLFNEAGLYTIAMVVTNTWGCADTIVKNLKIEEDLSIYVPNIFTPNGDGLNEIFIPVVRAVKSYELSVFDRWGAKIFSTTDPQTGWDGSYKGEPCKNDVYTWKISFSSINGEMKTMTGHVSLAHY